MDKDFMQYVCTRIEKALTENKEYLELQKKCADASKENDMNEYENASVEIECKATELSYLQGYTDGMRMILSTLKGE